MRAQDAVARGEADVSLNSFHPGLIDLQFYVPVTLNPGDAKTFNLWAELRSPARTQGRTLLILVSGFGTDHRYWDFPSGPSFVDAAVAKGYAVLNTDKLGTGYSDRPPATALGYLQDVSAIHQLVSAASSSQYGFSRIVLVGHSFGSTLIISEAATYADVSAIVLTGVTHTPGSGLNQFLADVIPVTQDPALSVQNYPPGYITLKAGSLGPLFFYPQTSFPSVIATNESIKTTVTPNENEVPQFFAAALGENKIRVPVLTVFGTKDILFGDTGTADRLRTEPGFYPNSAASNVFAVPDTGHSLALSTTVALTDAAIFQWLHQHVGGDYK